MRAYPSWPGVSIQQNIFVTLQKKFYSHLSNTRCTSIISLGKNSRLFGVIKDPSLLIFEKKIENWHWKMVIFSYFILYVYVFNEIHKATLHSSKKENKTCISFCQLQMCRPALAIEINVITMFMKILVPKQLKCNI